MMTPLRRVAALALAVLPMSAVMAADSDASAAIPTTPATVLPSAADSSSAASTAWSYFAKPVFLRGTLGDKQIQVTIRPKEVADEGLEGEYFAFGSSAKVLLAGEVEGEALLLEESENGTDISGQWDGKLQGGTYAGTWTSADGSITKPFSLNAIVP